MSLDQIEYAAQDVDILPQIAALQLNELAAENLLEVYTLESQVIRPVALMCHYGFGVDISKVKALQHLKQQELDTATRLFCESLDNRLEDDFKLPRRSDGSIAIGKNAKKEFNPGSNAQCVRCFNQIGTPLPVDARTGKQTLSQVALSEFDSDDETLNLLRKRTKLETALRMSKKSLSTLTLCLLECTVDITLTELTADGSQVPGRTISAELRQIGRASCRERV